VNTIILLCDYAEVIDGKLYVMGGGWTGCQPGLRNMAVAIKVLVPWDKTNIRHDMSLMLQDTSGVTIALGDPPQPVRHDGNFEVGRPPGIPVGAELDFAAAIGFVGLPLEPDKGYCWQLEINGEPAAHASFRTNKQ